MAIIIRGKTKCPLCQKVIQEKQSVTAFPAFVWNQLDSIFLFSDAGFHAECFRQHPLAPQAQARYEEFQQRVGPGRRECFICHHQITNQKDYLMIGYLTDDMAHFLHQFNYAQFHRSCFSSWDGRQMLIEKISAFNQTGEWGGDSLGALLAELS